MILGIIIITNAQIKENELKLPPKIEEMVVTKLKNEPVENFYRYGIKNEEQFEKLQLGRPIREYIITDKDTLMPQGWRVPVMYEGKALFLAQVSARDAWFSTPGMGEGIHHYERKDLMGILMVNLPGLGEYFYIRRENNDVFVQVFDFATRQYFKNEYSLSEIISLRNRVLELRAVNTKESRKEIDEIFGTNQVHENDIFDTNFPQKHELKMTPEITEMLVTDIYWSFINDSDWNLSNFGITNRAQLENLQLGKPIPEYMIDIDNEKLIFIGRWHVPVMSDGEPLFTAKVSKWGEDEQYSYRGASSGGKTRHNYKHQDLIIGYIQRATPGMDYYIIRREHKDVFVQVIDPATRENFKNEYSFSEFINLLKK